MGRFQKKKYVNVNISLYRRVQLIQRRTLRQYMPALHITTPQKNRRANQSSKVTVL